MISEVLSSILDSGWEDGVRSEFEKHGRMNKGDCGTQLQMMTLLIRLCERHTNAQALLSFSGGDVEVAVRVLPSLFQSMPHDREVCIVGLKLFCELTVPWSYIKHTEVKENLAASTEGYEALNPLITW